MKRLKTVLILGLVLFSLIFMFWAVAWGTSVFWQENGVLIGRPVGNEVGYQIISDVSGGAIITWTDTRSGYPDIYAQKINSNGQILWPTGNPTTDGVAICTAANRQRGPTITSDGSGGAIITWYDKRNGGDYDIYAQRVNANGTVQWTADGVAICTSAYDQFSPTIISDGSNGAIITWQDYRSGNYDIYAQRINAGGTVQWTSNGVTVCKAALDQYEPHIMSDGSSGAIITWYDYRSGTSDIYAQRIDPNGLILWPTGSPTTDAVAICTAAQTQAYPQLTNDGSGGAIITWEDRRNSDYPDIYVQRVNASGVPQWTANGVAICTATLDQYSPRIVSDGSGGAIITWYDYRSGNYNIYAQSVNASGVPQWTANGVVICNATGSQNNAQIISDGSGGAIITWNDYRSGTGDIYTQKVNASGVPQWTANGMAVCTATGGQSDAGIISDGSIGGAIVTWTYTSTGYYDVYAQRIGEPPPPTVEATFPANSAVNVAVNSAINVTFSVPMNTASTEAAFKISPAAAGTFSWEGNKMIFTPGSNLAAKIKYTVTIETSAKDTFGNGLDGDADGNPGPAYTFSFTTSQYTPDLIALWHLNEGTGTTVYDSTPYGNNGTIEGATWVGKNLNFNGSDNFVLVTNPSTIELSNATYIAWFKTTTSPGWSTLLSSKNPFIWMFAPFDTTGELQVYIESGGWINSNSLNYSDGKWHQYAFTYNNGNGVVYYDGHQVGSGSSYFGTIKINQFYIGRRSDSGGYFNGALSEISIYNRAITSEEVRAQYQTANPFTWYVDAASPGGGTGTMDSPFKTINSAEAAAADGDEIHVKQGVYSLTAPGTGTISLKSGVCLKGGYKPNDWYSQEADPSKTIISGEATVPCMYGSGLTAATTIENFTISNGKVLALIGGGGLYIVNSSSFIKDCVFNKNDCSGTGNGGGGIYIDSEFSNPSPTISNCAFTNNYGSRSGGGIFVYANTSPIIRNCAFTSNSIDGLGGGIYNQSSNLNVSSCTFSGNSANGGGGGIFNDQHSPTILNCTFVGNSAGGYIGGGMANAAASPTVINCTFANNNNAGISSCYPCSPIIKNSIIYGNGGANIYNDTATPTVTYSCVGGGYAGTGNISSNPLFVNAPSNVHLQAGSPCKDTATSEGAPSTDLDGNTRPYGAGYDMGAYECYLTSSSYKTRVGSNEEWSWKNTQTGDKIPSGTIDDWFWRTWNSGSGRKVPSGEAHDWIWGEE